MPNPFDLQDQYPVYNNPFTLPDLNTGGQGVTTQPIQSSGSEYPVYKPYTPPAPQQQSWGDWLMSMGIRTVPAVVGGMVGGPFGAVLGGALGEAGAESYEGKPFNPAMIGLEGGLNAVPFANLAKYVPFGGPIVKGAVSAGLQGAGLGLTSSVPRHMIESGRFELPPTSEAVGGAIGGGLFGGVLGAGHEALFPHTPAPEAPVTKNLDPFSGQQTLPGTEGFDPNSMNFSPSQYTKPTITPPTPEPLDLQQRRAFAGIESRAANEIFALQVQQSEATRAGDHATATTLEDEILKIKMDAAQAKRNWQPPVEQPTVETPAPTFDEMGGQQGDIPFNLYRDQNRRFVSPSDVTPEMRRGVLGPEVGAVPAPPPDIQGKEPPLVEPPDLPVGSNVKTDAYNAYVDRATAAGQQPLPYNDWRLHQVSGIPIPTSAPEAPATVVTPAMRERLLQLGFRKDVIDRMDAQTATNLIKMAPVSSAGKPAPPTKASVQQIIASKMESPARMGAMQGNAVAAGNEIRVPRIIANREYITNMEKSGYELSKMDGDTAVFVKVDTTPTQASTARLPRELSGAKPRYKDYELQFNNDLDKALYIIAKEEPSKRDADYLAFVMDHLGLSEAEARALGKEVRKEVGGQVKDQPPGTVQLRQIYTEGKDTGARIPSGGEMSSEISQILRRIFKPNQPLKTGSMNEFEFRSTIGQIINETDRARAYQTTLDWHENVMHRHAAGDAEGANIASNIADLADQRYHELSNPRDGGTDIAARIPFSERLPRQPLQGGEAIPEYAFQPDEGIVSDRDTSEDFLSRAEINQNTETDPESRMNAIRDYNPSILEEAQGIYNEKDPKKIVENLAHYTAEEKAVQMRWMNAASDQTRHGIPIANELRTDYNRISKLRELAQAKYERASTRQLEGKDIGAKVPRQSPEEIIDTFRQEFKTTDSPHSADFMLPDGTLLIHDQKTHNQAAESLNIRLNDALEAGIVRMTGQGAEVNGPITPKQAQILADLTHFNRDKSIVVEVRSSNTMRGGYKIFDTSAKPDAIRAWVESRYYEPDVEAHIPGTRRTINSVEDLWQTKAQIGEKGQDGLVRDSFVRDRENLMSKEDLDKFKNHPIVRQLSLVIDQMINHILPPELQGKVTSTGILLDTNSYGMYSKPTVEDMPGAIHVNFPEMVRRFWKDPIQAARRFVSVVYHEAAHVGNGVPSRPFDVNAAMGDPYVGRFVRDYLNAQSGNQVLDHSADWAGRMIDLYERTGPKYAAAYEDGIRRILEGSAERTGKYSKQVQEAVLLYSRSRRAGGGETGNIPRASNESGLRAESTGDVSGDTETDGVRISALQRLKGITGWGQGGSKGVKLDPNAPNLVKEMINLPTNATTFGDVSAPGRQGLAMIFTPEFWKAMIPSLSAVSKGRADAIDASIRRLPTFVEDNIDVLTGKKIPSVAKEAGMEMMSLGHKLGPREEFSASRWIENGAFLGPEKIGGVPNPIRFLYKYTVGATAAASNRIFTTFLNHLRANRFERLMNLSRNMAIRGDETGRTAMEGVLGGVHFQSGKNIGFTKAVTPAEAAEINPFFNKIRAKEIADFVNTATGRGPLRTHLLPFKQTELNLEKSAGALGYALFAPKNTASRIRMLNPSTYIMASPFVRKQYLKAALSTAAAWWTFTELAKNADSRVEVNHDLTSADFGKVRIGDFRLDPAGGFQQFLVAYARLYQGGASSSATGEFHKFGEGYQAQTAFDTGERMLANKLNPVAKFAWDLANASQYNPFHVKDRTAQMFVPLIVQDFIEIQKEDPNLLMPWMIPVIFGSGSQIYSKGESVSKFISPENDWNVSGGGLKDIMPWNLGGGQ